MLQCTDASLSPGASRTYAAYGGVYIAVALLWLWLVEKQRLASLQNADQLPSAVREQVEYLRDQADALDELNPCGPSGSSCAR